MRVPSYRLHKASGQAVVVLNGNTLYLGKFGSDESKTKYRRVIAAYMENGRAPTEAALTVAQAVERFTAAVVDKSHDRADDSHYRCAFAPLLQLFASEPVTSIGPLRFREVRAVYPTLGWSVTHCNAQADRLKRFLRWLVCEEQFPAERLQSIKALPRISASRVAKESFLPVSWDLVDATCSDLCYAVRGLVYFLWWTGARPSEACQVAAESINRDGRLKLADGTVERLSGVWIFSPKAHKTRARGHERYVLIGPKAQAMLAPYLQGSGSAFRPADVRAGASTQYTPTSLGRAIARATNRLGVEHWCPYSLRHAAATRFRAAGGLEVARTLLGHAPVTVTERYARPDWHRAAQVISEIG